ncbi:MAG: CoA-binding protein [Nanoarchaeota archaeon]|nr:CoA-binding protein [Nanoarchaeota archaeon]MBU4086911.1 CoA-binding protein [Nanoarchaeota archaeon]
MVNEGVENLLASKVFAVVGASRGPEKVGHAIFKNLLANKHILALPVNPNAVEILGKRCYKDLYEVPYNIDCVIIAVKAEFVLEIMKQTARRKIKNAIILSAGFSEAGNLKLEEEVLKIAGENEISVMGPNCFGFIDTLRGINTTFFQGIPSSGGIAFISQSGALGVGFLDLAIKEKIGLSGFASIGISMMLDFSDFIDYYSKDRNTKVIALYIESLKEDRGRRFIDACLRCKKPILVLKAGKSVSGQKASSSHTAALASDSGVYESMFRQAGVIEVNSMRELILSSEILSQPYNLGRRACIVSNAGGLGVLASDALEKSGILVPSLPPGVLERLNKVLPFGWSRNNPIDLVGDALADRYWQVLSRIDSENWFDFFIVLLTPQYMTETEKTAELLTHLKKPVFACFYGGEKVESAVKFLKDKKISVFSDVSDLGVLGKLAGE